MLAMEYLCQHFSTDSLRYVSRVDIYYHYDVGIVVCVGVICAIRNPTNAKQFSVRFVFTYRKQATGTANCSPRTDPVA